jgi:hypothetical protein
MGMSKAPVIMNFVLALAMVLGLISCGKKEEQPATKGAGQPTEVKRLVDDTKRYAERLKAQPAGGGPSPEQLAKLTALLDQLLRHMEEKAQAQQQGGDVSRPNAQIAADLAQLQEVQGTLPAATGDQGTPPAAGQEKPALDMISENLAKITQIVKQGQELVALLRPPKGQPGDPSVPSASGTSEGTPPTDRTQASDSSPSSTGSSATAPATTGSSSGASGTPAPVLVAQAGGQPAPVTTGYARVYISASPGKGRLQIKVNGLLAGQYDASVNQDLGPLLVPGANNTITFTFNQPGGGVDLSVMAPDSDRWVVILKFVASPGKLEDSVQIPYVGGKK